MWTQIRLLLQEQSDLILHCLLEMLLKHFSRRQKQTNIVVIGALTQVFYTVYFIVVEVYFMSSFKNSGSYRLFVNITAIHITFSYFDRN